MPAMRAPTAAMQRLLSVTVPASTHALCSIAVISTVPVDRKLVPQVAEMAFTDEARNVVLVGSPGTGQSHLASAVSVAGITQHRKARAVLLDGRLGQCADRRSSKQGWAHCGEHAALGRDGA